MASIAKLISGNWRAQVRRKGRYAAQTFRRQRDAQEWALEVERCIDKGLAIAPRAKTRTKTFGDLIRLHVSDLLDVGKPIRRSKAAVMEALVKSMGSVALKDLSRERFIEFGKKRAKEGAGPVTLSIDFSYIGTVLTHAAAVHGIDVSSENVRLARVALKRFDLVGPGVERDRRPTPNELEDLLDYFTTKRRQLIPMDRIIRFAIATAMRQDEICSFEWGDVDSRRKLVNLKNRKDPRKKDGNHQNVPLLNLTGFDAWELILEQRVLTRGIGGVFPHNGQSVGAAFRRACQALDIEDLHFHDLRHEATSRLFEAGLPIEKVALVTGHKDWRMLRRYTNLKAEDLHRLQTQTQSNYDDYLAKLSSFQSAQQSAIRDDIMPRLTQSSAF